MILHPLTCSTKNVVWIISRLVTVAARLAGCQWVAGGIFRRDTDLIEVWGVRLVGSGEDLAACRGWLSGDERERAAGYKFEHLAERFVWGRGVLRFLVGSYLRMPPQEVRFGYGAEGKPRVEASECDLTFNVSHSDEMALYAFSRGRELGIDIERERASEDLFGIAEQLFHPGEAAGLRALPESERAAAFFACWTKKEAYIKARGGGLSIPLDSFRVGLGGEGRETVNGWTVEGFAAAPGYRGALAYGGAKRPVRRRKAEDASKILRSRLRLDG